MAFWRRKQQVALAPAPVGGFATDARGVSVDTGYSVIGIIERNSMGQLTYQDLFEQVERETNGAAASGSISAAMACTPFWRGMHFLAQSLASVPLHVYRRTDAMGGRERLRTPMARTIGMYWTDDLTAYDAIRWMVQQSILHGTAYAEVVMGSRGDVIAIQPLETRSVNLERVGGVKQYKYTPGETASVMPTSKSRDLDPMRVIALDYYLGDDLLCVESPVKCLRRAIDLWLALEAYASSFFRNGGVPPLLVEQAVSSEKVARRAKEQMTEAVKKANKKGDILLFLPPDVKVVPIAFKPQEGQMTDARRFQLEEIARVLGVPPVFLQDLTRATYSNVVQQDLHAVKHVISKLAMQLECQINLKVFGRGDADRFAEFDLAGLERGDFQSRTEALIKSVQTGLLTPNEARALENRPPAEEAEAAGLFMQGATLPIANLPNPAEKEKAEIDVMKHPPAPPAPPGGMNGGGAKKPPGGGNGAKKKPAASMTGNA